jgi:hypothetical protein
MATLALSEVPSHPGIAWQEFHLCCLSLPHIL